MVLLTLRERAIFSKHVHTLPITGYSITQLVVEIWTRLKDHPDQDVHGETMFIRRYSTTMHLNGTIAQSSMFEVGKS